MRAEPLARFMAHVDKNGPYSPKHKSRCWVWTGGKTNGYGQFYPGDGRKNSRAHRWYWEHTFGPLSSDLDVDHECRNRACVRLTHLRSATRSENLAARPRTVYHNAMQATCQQGHEYDYVLTQGARAGHRVCKQCAADRQRKYRERKANA